MLALEGLQGRNSSERLAGTTPRKHVDSVMVLQHCDLWACASRRRLPHTSSAAQVKLAERMPAQHHHM